MDVVPVVGVMIPIVALFIPIVAILMGPLNRRMAMNERREARQLYERIAMEKLDVMKTAIAMGHNQSELRELDERLSKLIGADQLNRLLDDKTPGIPQASAELRGTDLSDELRRMEQQAKQAE